VRRRVGVNQLVYKTLNFAEFHSVYNLRRTIFDVFIWVKTGFHQSGKMHRAVYILLISLVIAICIGGILIYNYYYKTESNSTLAPWPLEPSSTIGTFPRDADGGGQE